eukprot:12585-Heterococcus_DN1.PRE.2
MNTKRVCYAVGSAHAGCVKGLASSAACEQSSSQVSLLRVGSAFSPQRAAKQRGNTATTVTSLLFALCCHLLLVSSRINVEQNSAVSSTQLYSAPHNDAVQLSLQFTMNTANSEQHSSTSAHEQHSLNTDQLCTAAAVATQQQDSNDEYYDSEADDQCAQHYSSHHIFATYASSVPPASTLTANFKQSGGPRAYPYTAAPVTTVSTLLSACMNSTAGALTAASSCTKANGRRKTVKKAVGHVNSSISKSSRPVTARTAYVQCCEELHISPLPLFDGLQQQQQQYTVAASPVRVTSSTAGTTAGATAVSNNISNNSSSSSVDFSGRLAAHKQPPLHTANNTGGSSGDHTAQQSVSTAAAATALFELDLTGYGLGQSRALALAAFLRVCKLKLAVLDVTDNGMRGHSLIENSERALFFSYTVYVRNSLKDAHVAARVGALLKPSHSSSSISRSGSDSSSTFSSRSSSSSHTSTTAHTTASGRTAPAAAVVVQAAAFVSSECSIVELKLEQCSISAAALAAMAAGLTASTSLQ